MKFESGEGFVFIILAHKCRDNILEVQVAFSKKWYFLFNRIWRLKKALVSYLRARFEARVLKELIWNGFSVLMCYAFRAIERNQAAPIQF